MKEHLNVAELEARLKETCSVEQFKRWQVILLRTKNPTMRVMDIASTCMVSYKTVTQWSWLYNTEGPEALILLGRGGRHRCLLSKAAESELLNGLRTKASAGHIVTALSVKQAAEKILGRELPKDYAYDLLHRHHWRKIMPHTHHPSGSAEAREAFKKTSRIFWLPPETV